MREIRVAHAVPGRVRLRIPEVRGNPAAAADVRARLSRIPSVRDVQCHLDTGSVIVLFDTNGTVTAEHLRALSETFPALDVGHAGNGLGVGNGNGHGPRLDRHVVGFFRTVNSGVSAVTHGLGVGLIAPLGLLVLGVRKLMASDRVPVPRWYDYFWFALGTFLMLNAVPFRESARSTKPA